VERGTGGITLLTQYEGRVTDLYKVEFLLTCIAPTIRQMESSIIIPPSTATTTFIPTKPVTDTHRKFRLAFGTLQKIPNLKLRKIFKLFHRITKSDY
jgi:hypothetical protein